jgi:hypothetical protein
MLHRPRNLRGSLERLSNCLEEAVSGNVNWIHLAQDVGQWLASLNMEMSLRVPRKVEHFLTS